ncbi:MAG: glycine cleavage system protein GcvH [Peptococcaceae bacterium]|nr:glycine cleavage system protein GcvH [Peptococcaceae bacterium]
MIMDGLLYSEDHEWIKVNGKSGRLGITHYAQEALGSVVFIELPEEGSRVAAGEPLGVVESVKAASDYYAPVSGKITAVNGELLDSPGLINEDPYGKGWIAEIELEDPAELDKLLSPEKYGELLEKEGK